MSNAAIYQPPLPGFLQSKWEQPKEYPDLVGEVAIDLETYDPELKSRGPGWCYQDERSGRIVGISVCSKNFKGYFPIEHANGLNMPKKTVLRWFTAQMKRTDNEKIFANAYYDMGWLKRYGIEVHGKIHDVQIAAPLLDEYRLSYSLDNLSKDYIGDSKDESGLIQAVKDHGLKDPKKDLWILPPEFVGEYAEKDAELTYRLHQHYKPMLAEQELNSIYDLEMSLLPLLLEMRMRGVPVDIDLAEQRKKEFTEKKDRCIQELRQMSGVLVDIWAADSIGKAYDALGYDYRLTTTGKPSFTRAFLEEEQNDFAKMLLEARRYDKAMSPFLDTILEKNCNGRIHAQFHQLKAEREEGGGMGTVSGRFSSSVPNLQNIPSRDSEIGPALRSAFIPEVGEKFGCGDYSSQEPRLTIHYAALCNMEGADEAVRRICEDPDIDYHSMVAEITGLERKPAKTINLGIAYGMQEASLCRRLGLPTVEETYVMRRTGEERTKTVAGPEGKEVLARYHEKMPFISGMQNLSRRRADKIGYITTLLGRRCRFPRDRDDRWRLLNAALNRLIQGSAADQMKKSMVEMYKEGIIPLLTVHDEVCISSADPKVFDRAKEIMVNCVQLKVPSKVDFGIGKNWAEAKR